MQWSASYPRDLIDACMRKPSQEELDDLIRSSNYPPLFVYGHMMLPTVLKYFADIPQSARVDMFFATLGSYKLHHFSDEVGNSPSLPTIRQSTSPFDHVEGMLVFGLTQKQRSIVSEIEGGQNGQAPLIKVQVVVSQLDMFANLQVSSQRLVDAGASVWIKSDRWSLEAVKPMETSHWPIDKFLESQLYTNIVQHQNRTDQD
ncbi:hypothetical protein BJY04DRAFT_184733 [Aspergillus karnatakaensis]|uniref:uncharacterized protein n=1 Tax=Aspergillus karnatakaensis TaxID=1810916 RepID=UPI003CCE0CC8